MHGLSLKHCLSGVDPEFSEGGGCERELAMEKSAIAYTSYAGVS